MRGYRILSAVMAVVALSAALALPVRAQTADVPPEQDDPPGCTTATSEDDDGCGAQGRDHFGNAGHRPPIDACATTTAPTGSTITRITPTGPTREDGSLAFTSGACVYLPPGYAESDLRYPVVYLLHGGGGDQADWKTFGDAQRILDEAYAADPANAAIAVLPDGRSGQWYDFLDGTFRIETYVLRHLVPAVDARFRTIDDRTGRAVIGLSNGGYGALHLAAKAPDRFVAAGAMSANLGARTFSELGEGNRVYYQGNVPYQLAANLDPVDLIIDWGATCTTDLLVDGCATWAFEQAFRADNMAFRTRLDEVEYRGTVDYRETEGSHAWRWWSRWLAERHLPFALERLADPAAGTVERSPLPATFRYRSIFDRFSVWGYDVEVQRDVQEFLDLTEVGADGFTIQGSGQAVVTTAGRYRPGGAYVVDGATTSPTEVQADRSGRLRIPVDLGPSHAHEQFSNEADVDAAVAGTAYWTVRTVTIAPAGVGPGGVTAEVVDGPPASSAGFGAGAPGSPLGSPVAGPTEVAAREQPLGRVAAASSEEIVRRVSVPLTAAFLTSLAGGAAVWWRRRAARRVVTA